jgi:hypothetical protein
MHICLNFLWQKTLYTIFVAILVIEIMFSISVIYFKCAKNFISCPKTGTDPTCGVWGPEEHVHLSERKGDSELGDEVLTAVNIKDYGCRGRNDV